MTGPEKPMEHEARGAGGGNGGVAWVVTASVPPSKRPLTPEVAERASLERSLYSLASDAGEVRARLEIVTAEARGHEISAQVEHAKVVRLEGELGAARERLVALEAQCEDAVKRCSAAKTEALATSMRARDLAADLSTARDDRRAAEKERDQARALCERALADLVSSRADNRLLVETTNEARASQTISDEALSECAAENRRQAADLAATCRALEKAQATSEEDRRSLEAALSSAGILRRDRDDLAQRLTAAREDERVLSETLSKVAHELDLGVSGGVPLSGFVEARAFLSRVRSLIPPEASARVKS